MQRQLGVVTNGFDQVSNQSIQEDQIRRRPEHGLQRIRGALGSQLQIEYSLQLRPLNERHQTTGRSCRPDFVRLLVMFNKSTPHIGRQAVGPAQKAPGLFLLKSVLADQHRKPLFDQREK
ncbi:hypothetical protein D3C72_462040 [compost metagenome]